METLRQAQCIVWWQGNFRFSPDNSDSLYTWGGIGIRISEIITVVNARLRISILCYQYKNKDISIKTMTENVLDIQTISTKRTDEQADRVLLLGQVTEKKEKAYPTHLFKFLFQPTFGTFAKPLKPTHNPGFAKEPNLPTSQHYYTLYHYSQVKTDFFTTIGNLFNLLFVSLQSG